MEKENLTYEQWCDEFTKLYKERVNLYYGVESCIVADLEAFPEFDGTENPDWTYIEPLEAVLECLSVWSDDCDE